MIKDQFRTGTFLCYTTVITLLLFYGLPFSGEIPIMIRLASLYIVIILFLCHSLPKIFFLISHIQNLSPGWKNGAKRGLILLATTAVGLLFLGNLLADHSLTKSSMQFFGKWVGPIEVKILPKSKHLPEPERIQTSSISIGDFRELDPWNGYCRGLLEFVMYYGWLLIMILTTNYLFKNNLNRPAFFSVRDLTLYEIFLLAVTGIPLFLFFTDFTNFGSRTWYKSRLLEIPVYLIIFISFYFIDRVCSRKQKIVISLLLIAYMVIPFLATERHKQINYNWKIFLDLPRS